MYACAHAALQHCCPPMQELLSLPEEEANAHASRYMDTLGFKNTCEACLATALLCVGASARG